MDSNIPEAFPSNKNVVARDEHHRPGMSLLDYFAGQAIPALIALKAMEHKGLTRLQLTAIAAYEVAEAMLAERERRLNNSQQ